MIQAFTHTREESEEARRLAGEFDDEAERLGVRSLGVRLLPATRLTYTLRVPGLRIVEPIQEMHWQRKTENVAWGVEVPASYRLGSVIGTVTVAADGIPLGRITFKLDILPIGKGKTVKMDALDPVATGAEKFKHAFISYASQDPVIVEGPPPVPPPPELAHLHFNDPLIYFREPLRSS